MDFFTSLQHQLDALQRLMGADPAARSIPARLHQLSDRELQETLELAASLQSQSERLRFAASSVLAQRTRMAEHAQHTHARVLA